MTAFDPHYYIPAVAPLTIYINFPPQKGILEVTPNEGLAIFTDFEIKISNLVDLDTPFSYKVNKIYF